MWVPLPDDAWKSALPAAGDPNRPVACVRRRPHDVYEAMCRRVVEVGEYTLIDKEHALLHYEAPKGPGLRACPKCCAAIRAEKKEPA
jgi:hypothetical protein